MTAGENDFMYFTVTLHLYVHFFGQGVDDRYADAVQTAGDRVAAAAEFTAGVEHRQHDFDRGTTGFMHVDRNAAAVIDHGHAVIRMNRDFNMSTETGQRFVDGVIYHFIHQMVQTARRSITDVHPRTFANGLQPFQDLNILRAVAGFTSICCHSFLFSKIYSNIYSIL